MFSKSFAARGGLPVEAYSDGSLRASLAWD